MTVQAAISRVLESRWAERSQTVAAQAQFWRTDAIASADNPEETDAWLTWFIEAEQGVTRLRLAIEELEEGPDPSSDIDELLGEVARLAGADPCQRPPNAAR